MEHIKLSSDAIKRFKSYDHRKRHEISYQRTKTDCKWCGGKCRIIYSTPKYAKYTCKVCGYKYKISNEMPPHTEEQIKFVQELVKEFYNEI